MALMTLVECQQYLVHGQLPDDLRRVARVLLQQHELEERFPGQIEGPRVRQRHPALSPGELRRVAAGGALPDDFAARCRKAIISGACDNCDDVRDMAIRLRHWDDGPSPCPHCCDPETGELVTLPAVAQRPHSRRVDDDPASVQGAGQGTRLDCGRVVEGVAMPAPHRPGG